MSGATHFIEVYRDNICGGMNHTHRPLPLDKMDEQLSIGVEVQHFETIAIFYIKAKNKSDDNRK